MLAEHLAKNLLTLRRLRNLSQSALAKQSGIPRSTLTNIESGTANPSLKIMAKLAETLQVSIEELLSQPRSACTHIKAEDVPFAARGLDAGRLYKLLPDPIPGMEIDRLELKEGCTFAGVPHVANTKEYLTVIQGNLRISVAGEQYELKPGDVLAFPGDQKHSYCNTGTGLAICISVVVLARVI
jgi:transcriptional regulator with XRE-family HTH domain